MINYYRNYHEQMEVLKYVLLETELSKFIKSKGNQNNLSELKRKQLRQKRKKKK